MADGDAFTWGGTMNRLSYSWVALVLLSFSACTRFDSDPAKAVQKAWADNLGTPVQITNSLGMKLNLIPPGAFVMGIPKSDAERWDSFPP